MSVYIEKHERHILQNIGSGMETKTSLIKKTGFSWNTIDKYVKILFDRGWLKKVKKSEKQFYYKLNI